MTEEYLKLFNAITDAIEVLEALRLRLMEVQIEVEEMYIGREE